MLAVKANLTKCLVEKESCEDKVSTLKSSVGDLKADKQNTLQQVENLTVLTKGANDNIKETLTQLSKKDKYNLSFAFDPLCGLKVGKDKFLHSLVWNYDPKKPNKLQSYSKIIDTDKSIGANTKKLTRVK